MRAPFLLRTIPAAIQSPPAEVVQIMAKFSKLNTTDAVRKMAVCARVSSDELENEGFSIPAQIRPFKSCAATQGFVVAKMVQALRLADHVKRQLA